MDDTDFTQRLSDFFSSSETEIARVEDKKIYALIQRMSSSVLGDYFDPDNDCSKTVLSNEAVLKLLKSPVEFKSQLHFYATLSKVMRQVLVDRIRKHNAKRRFAEREYVQDADVLSDYLSESILKLELFLDAGQLSSDEVMIMELKYFLGETNEKIAELMGCSERTVHRKWTSAKTAIKEYLDEDVFCDEYSYSLTTDDMLD